MKNWATQNPANAEARIELARLYEEANDPSTAMKYLEDAVQKDANNPRAWLALAKLRQQSGDLQQALQNYQQSLAINPAQPMAAAEVAKLNHQISGSIQAPTPPGQTQIAAPAYGGGFMNRY
jgi:tetratricopeptide (TPR) repeat protein